MGLLVAWLATPLAAVVPGHPLVAWGFLLPKWGWAGVVAMFICTAGTAVFLRSTVRARWPGQPWRVALSLLAIAAVVYKAAEGERIPNTRLAGQVGALSTKWGGFPKPGSTEVMVRIGRIGHAVAALSGGEGAVGTVIFPETIIGLYDPSLFDALENDINRVIRRTGQTVVLGADIMTGNNTAQNIAIILRPDGTSTWLSARQTAPAAQWRPWNSELHMPADWFSVSTAVVAPKIRARFMFCHEEYMPILHLLSEAREDHQMVIAMSNLWAARSPLANDVQAAHSVGMAKLFGRPIVRAVNLHRDS